MLFKLLERLRNKIKRTESHPPPCDTGQVSSKRWKPRTEILILLVGLACTILGKLIIILHQTPPLLLSEIVGVVLPDILFFAVIFLVISCLYAIKPTIFVVRVVMIISILISSWSILNFGWLIKSGTQFQPSILTVAIRNFGEVWPLVFAHLLLNRKLVIPLLLLVSGISIYFLRHIYKPHLLSSVRIHHAYGIVSLSIVILILVLVQSAVKTEATSDFVGEVLGFSSHWYALTSTVSSLYSDPCMPVQTRNIPKVGERNIGLPQCPASELPNIVVVMLESFSYSATSLCEPSLGTTPFLAGIAKEGVEFRQTRALVPRTSKAFWAALTGMTPIIESGYVEAVPVYQPYESLASILSRLGYKSAFFEMSKGSFECAPGLFSNLAFDWAWFRENLEDPSANLGYMSGDDLQIIKPAFEWVSKDSKPFFLMLMSTVSHDPYEIPAWFEKPKEKPYDRYLQSLRYTDYFLEQVCRLLQEKDLEKNTILCIIGDHGTSFRTPMGNGRWIPYEEVIRVPWVISWPGHLRAGQIIDWPCSQMDVTPTILNLIGFDISKAGFEGKDALMPSRPDRRSYFSSLYLDSPMGFIEANRKVVYWQCLDKVFEYNLDADPKEENPTILSIQETEQIKREMRDWQEKSQIFIKAKRHTDRILFTHWHTFSTGRSAWAYYVP